MASKESFALEKLYRGWVAEMAANPNADVDELRRLFDHWGDVTAEPGGVDYIEVDAGGVPAMWALPKQADTQAGFRLTSKRSTHILHLLTCPFIGSSCGAL